MSHAPKYDERDIELRAKALDMFLPADVPEIRVSAATPTPERKRWLPPKKNPNGGYDVRHTGGEVRTFPTLREAEDFFEREAGIGKR